MPVFITKTNKQPKDIITDYIELDKAGIIYPYVATNDWNSVYRVEAKLSKKLNFTALKAAVEAMRNAFPYFFMTIAKKNRRFVLTKAKTNNVLVENIYPVCRPFDLESKKPLVRVIYDSSTIAVELFHVLADGHGGERFFKALLESYRKNLSLAPVAPQENKEGEKMIYELSDIYEEFSKQGGKNVSRFMTKAFQFKAQEKAPLQAKCINVSVDDLKAAAKRKGVSITMFVCALQIAAIFETEKRRTKPSAFPFRLTSDVLPDLKQAETARFISSSESNAPRLKALTIFSKASRRSSRNVSPKRICSTCHIQTLQRRSSRPLTFFPSPSKSLF